MSYFYITFIHILHLTTTWQRYSTEYTCNRTSMSMHIFKSQFESGWHHVSVPPKWNHCFSFWQGKLNKHLTQNKGLCGHSSGVRRPATGSHQQHLTLWLLSAQNVPSTNVCGPDWNHDSMWRKSDQICLWKNADQQLASFTLCPKHSRRTL